MTVYAVKPVLGFRQVLKAAIELAVVAGLAHAIGEVIILRVFQARLMWLDAILLALFASGSMAVGFVLAGLAVFGVHSRARSAASAAPDLPVRRGVVAMVWMTYLAASVFLLRHHLGTKVGMIALGCVGLLSIVLLRSLWPRLSSTGCLAVALLGLVLANIGGVAWATQPLARSPQLGISHLVRFSWLLGALLPATVMYALLSWCPRPLTRSTLRQSIAVLVMLLATLAVASSTLPAVEGTRRIQWRTADAHDETHELPNIVLVVLDTVSARHMDLFGYPARPTMPLLSRFAREKCDVVTTCLAPSPWTPPTHASIFTGTWPHVHGCRRPTPEEIVGKAANPYYCMGMRDDLPTLAEWLSDRGYACGAFAGNPALSGYGLPRGFHHFDARMPAENISWARRVLRHTPSFSRALMRAPSWARAGLGLFDPFAQDWRKADVVNGLALTWLKNNDAGPFFLFVNYLDAHTPYKPASAAARLSRLPAEYLELTNRLWESYSERSMPIPADMVRELSSLYDESLRELDRSVDGLLRDLMTRPDLENTLLIITSDHGEEFMEHGDLEHSTNVYEPQVRTPMLVRFPESLRQNPPEISAGFQQIDLFATIASVVGKGAPPETDGRAWGNGRGYALSEVFENPTFSARYRLGYCCVTAKGFKYIRLSNGSERLYDLATDAGEARDIVAERPELARLYRELVHHRDERMRKGTKPTSSSAVQQNQRLRRLGYVE